MKDYFYREFENRYRGSRELIKSRLVAYLPFVQPLLVCYSDASAIDLGCGRGEWIELLASEGFAPCGVDSDEGMLQACIDLGLKVAQGDAIAYLATVADESQVVVSAFHVVEHIEFDMLRALVVEALRVLKPGGLLIMETPNPENIIVATRNFYLDPTHQRPIPPELLSFVPDHYGFFRTKILRLQEATDLREKEVVSFLEVLGGASPDYAVIAQKAAEKSVVVLFDHCFSREFGVTLDCIAQRYDHRIDERLGVADFRLQQVEVRVEQEVARTEQAEQRGQQAELRAQQTEIRALQAEARVQQEVSRTEQAEQRGQQAELRAQQTEIRALQAEARVQQEVARTEQAEQRGQQAELRAQQTEIRALQAEARVQQEVSRTEQAEQRGQQAELRAQQTEIRALQAEARVQQEVARTEQAEQRGQQAELRAQQTEIRALQAEARVQQEVSRTEQAEQRGQQAESLFHQSQGELLSRMAELLIAQERCHALEQTLTEMSAHNHHHWQLAESRAAEIDAMAVQGAKTQQQFSDCLQAYANAQALLHQTQQEIEYWHGRVLQLHASTSWQITKPMRYVKRLLFSESSTSSPRQALYPKKHSLVFRARHSLRTGIAHGIRYVFMRPQLHSCLSRALKKIPWLHRRLLSIGKHTGAVGAHPLLPAFRPAIIAHREQADLLERSRVGPYAGKKVAVLAPEAANGTFGGAERFNSGLVRALGEQGCDVDLVCIKVDESTFEAIQQGYQAFADLDLSAYDLVISTKAPSYNVKHPNHVLYLVHTVRVFYDMFGDLFPAPSSELLTQRDWIHRTDSEAIARIAKRFSIGAEVSRRLVQWNGCDAEVLHPPIDVAGLYDLGIGDYFFMPGRLHPWKRVDLAIKAIKCSDLPLRLLISGLGEAEESLRELADGDERIEFLGQVDDERLKVLYAGALAVPFVPLREDYGYVTLEAFASGKPVITCTDSGEPTEFVEHGVTGLVCAPDPKEICSAFELLWNDRPLAKRLGHLGRGRVAEIQWPAVAGRLLAAGFSDGVRRRGAESKRLRVAILDMQPIMPAVGGGRLRLLGLYHALGDNIQARYVGSYDWAGEKYRRHFVSPTLEEIDIPLSTAHHAAAADAAEKAGGRVVIDMLFGRQAHLSPDYIEEAISAVGWADVVVFSHPWVASLIDDERLVGKTVVYDSQNVEITLREQLLDKNMPFERLVLDEVASAERRVGERADLVLACSIEDVEGFASIYGWPRAKISIVPNGVFGLAVQPPTPEQKETARSQFNLRADRAVAFFIGSDYAPNVEAARILMEEIAPALPQIEFVLAGGVCARLPVFVGINVRLMGFLDEEQRLAWLHAADLAISPMCSGSGTNIKMFDFMAAGLPIVTTAVGARGIVVASTEGIRIAEIKEMASAIALLLSSPEAMRTGGIENRVMVERKFLWEKISPDLGARLRGAWHRKAGAEILRSGGVEQKQRIAHLTTMGLKCGIGEYTKKIVDIYEENGIQNLVLTCDSPAESPLPLSIDVAHHVAWYFDNKNWNASYIKPDTIARLREWQASGVLIQYHAGFYPPNTLLQFVKGCIENDISAAVVVHNYTEQCAVSFRLLNELSVSVFSHRKTEVDEARTHGVLLECIPLGVDVREPLRQRDIENRNWVDSPPVIITNGFLRKHKGVRELIKAMPKIVQAFPGAQLRIQCSLYSSDDSNEELDACLQEILASNLSGNVVMDTRFLEKSDLLTELAKADLAVLPYEQSNEGGSAAATDAFAVGLPLIVSTAAIFDGIRDFVMTSPPGAGALAHSIMRILSSQKEYGHLAKISAGYARENSWDKISGAFLLALN